MNEQGMNKEELFEHIESNQSMTPQEKRFAKQFYHDTIFVKDMDNLTLRAHIEELEDIAFRAKVSYHAAKAEEDRRNKKPSDGKPTGFRRSVNDDEAARESINIIKERQGRTSKKDKIQANLVDMYKRSGMS